MDPIDLLMLLFHMWSEGPLFEHEVQKERRRQAQKFLVQARELLRRGFIERADLRFGLALRLRPDILNSLSKRQKRKLMADLVRHGGGPNATLLLLDLDERQLMRNFGQQVYERTSMLRIRYAPPLSLDLSGSQTDLESLRAAVLALIQEGEGEYRVAASTEGNAFPYTLFLGSLRVRVGAGPTLVKVVDESELVVEGSPKNLGRFCSFLVVGPDPVRDWHCHYEYFEGNPYIDRDSIPLVVSLEKPNREVPSKS
jgi:hypothetical protein